MRLLSAVLMTTLISAALFAQDIKIIGKIIQPIHQDKKFSLRSISNPNKKITLLKMELSADMQQELSNRAERLLKTHPVPEFNQRYPRQVQLGMSNVPVLDQGQHGTCATFASTAAVDALLNRGDYISQLCQLQLGKYLESVGSNPSGWDGSFGRIVLQQMSSFGIVSKEQESSLGCSGLTKYPLVDEVPEGSMNLDEYSQMSERFDDDSLIWYPILDVYHGTLDRVNTNRILDEVKEALYAHDRVVLGVLLLDMDFGTVGAVGAHHTANDTWVLTAEMARDIHLQRFFAGHQMVITGYDDEAVAVDNNGEEHRGLLTLRNSWGPNAGDKGDFYMSYDYFKILGIEAIRIRKAQAQE